MMGGLTSATSLAGGAVMGSKQIVSTACVALMASSKFAASGLDTSDKIELWGQAEKVMGKDLGHEEGTGLLCYVVPELPMQLASTEMLVL